MGSTQCTYILNIALFNIKMISGNVDRFMQINDDANETAALEIDVRW